MATALTSLQRPPRMSYIAATFAELLRNSRRTGTLRQAPLAKGAALAVLVSNGTVRLWIARKNAPVGTGELETFRLDCRVPPGAVRVPETGQRTKEKRHTVNTEDGQIDVRMTWHYVLFKWEDVA